MNILRVIASMDPATGGPCQGIRNLVPELKKLGLRNEVVSLDEENASFLKEDVFQVHALGKGKGPWRYNRKLIPWLLKNLHRFDVVIIHGLWLYPSYAVTKAMQQLRKESNSNKQKVFQIPRVFVMPHGMLDPYFQKEPGRKLKAIRNIVYWKLIEKQAIKQADGILFTCQEELELARQPFRPYSPKREINVRYGIKMPPGFSQKMRQAFLKVCPGLGEDQYFLFLGRIHNKKGVDILIEAYSDQTVTEAKNGQLFPKLVIAGPGIETSYGVKIQEQIKSKPHLRNKIILPGLLLGDAKWGAYYGCETFILPSHQENFGIVVAEALACGKPVLISDKVNIWREIYNDDAGIVAPDTLEGVRELFNKWSALQPEKKIAMSKNAAHLFEANFTSQAAALRFGEVIEARD